MVEIYYKGKVKLLQRKEMVVDMKFLQRKGEIEPRWLFFFPFQNSFYKEMVIEHECLHIDGGVQHQWWNLF